MRWRGYKMVTGVVQWVLLAVMALTGAAGCGTDSGQAMPPSGSAPQVVEDSNGARFKVTVSGQEFTAEDEIRVDVEITNVTQQPIAYNGLNGCDDGIRVYVPTDGIKQKFAEKRPKDAEPRFCTEAITNKQLDPGQSVKKSVTLLPGVEKSSGDIEPVAPGSYQLRAELTRIRDNEEKIGVTVPITIK